MTERLALVDVGEVNVYDRQTREDESVAQGNAVVPQRGGVDQDGVRLSGLGLDEVDNRALVVGLEAANLDAEFCGALGHRLLDPGERLAAVDLRLPPPEQV